MPFKTKLTPNYQMNWGHDFPKAPYPKREKCENKTFDLKGYVNTKREEKINQMLNDAPKEDSMLPFGGMGMGMGANPFMQPDLPKKNNLAPSFDVDDLVKRIDAKIAELEEEERLEKEKAAKEQAKETTIEATIEPSGEPSVVQPVTVKPKPPVVEPKVINGITDDQFFDDFFSDE
jgi:hypothetical protein